jgi:hypothetical protein
MKRLCHLMPIVGAKARLQQRVGSLLEKEKSESHTCSRRLG